MHKKQTRRIMQRSNKTKEHHKIHNNKIINQQQINKENKKKIATSTDQKQ